MGNFDKLWKNIEFNFSRCRDIESYKSILNKFFSDKENKKGLSVSEISSSRNIYSKVKFLENKKIIEKVRSGSSKRMLVNLDNRMDRPCFNEEQIREKTESYGLKLHEHSIKDYRVMEILMSVTNLSDIGKIKSFCNNLLINGNLKKYNNAIDSLNAAGLFDESNNYWRLDWRPQRVNRYKISKAYI